MVDIPWTLIVNVVTVVTLLVWYLHRKTTYWAQKGVPGPKPQLLFGNMLHRSAARPNKLELEWQKLYGKIYGIYYGLRPVLSITDHELIKQVLVKDFTQWANRREMSIYHEVWNQNMFTLEAERWKLVRATVTPSFTSGKLKGMNNIMASCVDRLEKYFETILTNNPKAEFSVKEVITGLTLDVVAKTIFATETESNNATDRNNIFVKNAVNLFKFPKFKIFAFLTLPRWINDLLGVKIGFPDKEFQFFHDLSCKVMKARQANRGNGKYMDMMQLLVDASVDEKEVAKLNCDKLTAIVNDKDNDSEVVIEDNVTSQNKRKLTDNEILATSILLFVAGFETTASTLNHALFELAHNMELQERLHQEVSKAIKGLDEKSDEYYKVVNTGVPYLEAVMKETLRKYSPVIRLERRLIADNYKLGGIELERGQLVEIPTYAVHWNSEYYPEPEKFRPERFLPENKHLLTPYTYLPFGDGPRNCVGNRFAYQEIKLVLARLITRYRFENVSETPQKLKFIKGNPMLSAPSFPLSVERR